MPRKSRLMSSTGIYHITLRSVNQHIIFEEDADYQKLLFVLSDCKTIFDIDIYAYCLMDNHIHLLLHTSNNNLSSFFQSFGARFVHWYNTKYERFGHLFQDRYHSVPVESSKQYLSTLVYIHNNPVAASVCRTPSEYRWSSFNAFYGEKNNLIDPTYSYAVAGSKKMLLDFFSSNNISSDELYFSDICQPIRRFISDEKALYIYKSVTQLSSTSEVLALPKKVRNDFIKTLTQKGLTAKQLARLMDISVSTVRRVLK